MQKRIPSLFFVLAFTCLGAFLPAQSMSDPKVESKYVWKIATLAPKGIGWSIYTEKEIYPKLAEATE